MSQTNAALFCGVSPALLMRLEKLDYPINYPAKAILKISASLNILPDDIMPEEFKAKNFPTTYASIADIDPQKMLASISNNRLLLKSPIEQFEMKEFIETIKRNLHILTSRQREIIELRYGLTGNGSSYTIKEVSKILGRTHSNIIALEHEGLRKLKNLTPVQEYEYT